MAERDPGPGRDEGRDPVDEDAAWAAIVAGYDEEAPDPGLSPDSDTDGRDGGRRPAASEDSDAQGKRGEQGGAGTGAADGAAGTESGSVQSGTGTAGSREAGSGTPGSVSAETVSAGSGETAGTGEACEDGPEKTERRQTPADGPSGTGPVNRPLGSSVTFAVGVGPRDWSPSKDGDLDDEGHFEPPEPPPLPEADTAAKFAWLGALGGPVLLLATVLFRWDMTWWIATLGIGGFLGGFATLVARMRDGDGEDDEPGHGAVV